MLVLALDQEYSLEEGMATHSNIFAWRIPWMRGTWRAKVQRVTKSQTLKLGTSRLGSLSKVT